MRVLAVTGYDDRRYPDRVIEAGADSVLLKPLEPAALVAEARRLLMQESGGDRPAVTSPRGSIPAARVGYPTAL